MPPARQTIPPDTLKRLKADMQRVDAATERLDAARSRFAQHAAEVIAGGVKLEPLARELGVYPNTLRYQVGAWQGAAGDEVNG